MASNIDSVKVEISVVLGRSSVPMHQFCAWAAAPSSNSSSRQDDPVLVLANDTPVARGEILIQGDNIGVSIIELLKAQQWLIQEITV